MNGWQYCEWGNGEILVVRADSFMYAEILALLQTCYFSLFSVELWRGCSV